MKKKSHFFSKKNFIRKFLMTRRVLFLPTKNFCSSSKNDREKFFFIKVSSKNIYRDAKWSVLNTAQKNLPEGQIFSGQVPVKNWKRE